MKESVKEVIQDTLVDTKIAVAVSTGTSSSGLGTMLGMIPDDIGKLGVIVGMILSTVLIISHVKKAIYEYKDRIREIEKNELELAILRKKYEQTLEE